MNKRLGWLAIIPLLLGGLACQAITLQSLARPTSRPPILATQGRGQVLIPTPTSAPPLLVSPPASPQNNSDVLALLYEKASPGVVAIQIESEQGVGLGSGFVYDKDGHIITNYHVVEGATTLEVDFLSGFKVFGKVIGTDLDSDLAVVKVDAPADELVPLPLGDSSKLRVGDGAVAIGNPFGLNGTMTVGIISGIGRTLESIRQAPEGQPFTAGDVIQTDAAINPGNSGGPLLNLQGEVVGVNRAIRTDSTTISGEPTNSGIGFAVPINIVKRVVPSLISIGKYDYPYMGISSLPEISLVQAQALGLKRTTGAYITSVTPGSPADKAGLRAGDRPTNIQGLDAGGDLIIAVDGQPVRVFNDLLSYLMYNKSPGDQVVLTILRDNQEKEVTLTLEKRP